MKDKKFSFRFSRIDRTRVKILQARDLLNRLERSVSTPIDITEEPYGGVGILEKLGVIETWEVEGKHFAITRAS